jgi:protein SDA1
LKKLREEEMGGADDVDSEDDATAWEGWDVETDSDSESEPEGWIDVDSDGDDNLEVSDSEDEQSAPKPLDEKKLEIDADPNRVSTLATTKVNYSLYTLCDALT